MLVKSASIVSPERLIVQDGSFICYGSPRDDALSPNPSSNAREYQILGITFPFSNAMVRSNSSNRVVLLSAAAPYRT